MINLYLGGARSGKSRRALEQASGGLFVATAEAVDEEFRHRIEKHRAERGREWRTMECPLLLPELLLEQQNHEATILVDCLTVWLGNLMHHEQDIGGSIDVLIKVLRTAQSDIYLVTNEVGQGVVPEHPMGRTFRDWQGRLNQEVAAIADQVELLVAGIPLQVKP